MVGARSRYKAHSLCTNRTTPSPSPSPIYFRATAYIVQSSFCYRRGCRIWSPLSAPLGAPFVLPTFFPLVLGCLGSPLPESFDSSRRSLSAGPPSSLSALVSDGFLGTADLLLSATPNLLRDLPAEVRRFPRETVGYPANHINAGVTEYESEGKLAHNPRVPFTSPNQSCIFERHGGNGGGGGRGRNLNINTTHANPDRASDRYIDIYGKRNRE